MTVMLKNRRTRRRRLLIASAVGVAAAAAGAGWAWRRHTSDGGLEPLWQSSFPGVDGRPLALASLRGKPLVLNFWATWCAPCIKEMPQFDRFHQAYAARGWQVVGLAIDSDTAVAEFLKRTPVHYPVAVAGMEGAELMIALGNGHGALPFTVVLDADGRVLGKRLGETHYDELVGWAAKA
jgi:thiol-disulfide isomerase/thioredoxin